MQASVSYVTGSHNFKAGLGVQNNAQYGQWKNNGDIYEAWTIFGAPNAVLVMGNGDLEDERKMNCDCGLYAQDSWTVDRFTLNLGVRYDWFNNSLAGGNRPAGWFTPEITADPIKDLPDWKDWNGRLGVAYDLFGDGRTALKAFAGRLCGERGARHHHRLQPVRSEYRLPVLDRPQRRRHADQR